MAMPEPHAPRLFLVTHTIPEVTAKVPFAIMMLTDAMASKKIPGHLKCRQIVPTASTVSTSLWEAPDAAALLEYVDATMGEFATSQAFPVVPEYLHGVALDLGKSHIAENINTAAATAAAAAASTASTAATAASAKLAELDAKYKLAEKAKETTTKIKETTSKLKEDVAQRAQTAFAEGTLLGQGWGFLTKTAASVGERVTAAVREYNENEPTARTDEPPAESNENEPAARTDEPPAESNDDEPAARTEEPPATAPAADRAAVAEETAPQKEEA